MNEQNFLQELIDNERNSALFYSHLTTLTNNLQLKNILENISVECGTMAYRLILRCLQIKLTPTNNSGQIVRNISLCDGIKWAIDVESESMEQIKQHTKIATCYALLYQSKKNRLKKLSQCEKMLK